MDSSIVVFEPNVPVIVRLLYPDGHLVAGRGNVPRVMFSLDDGRRMFLDKPVADSIRMCQFAPGQPFTITKRVNGKATRWDVNPLQETPEPEKPVQAIPASIPQPERGNGTYGPAPQAQQAPRATPPQKIPANIAFGEIVAFINQELKYRGEQWNDEARQAAVCTLMIEAGRSGWLTVWERGK